MLERFPFSYRAEFLAALMVIAAIADLCRHGKTATRYKEYAFIWFTGLIGSVIGGANDFVTSGISPEYFTLGKGLADGDGFKMRGVLFGMKEGLSAGVIAGAICVYVARRKSRFAPLPFDRLLRLLWMPITGAVAGALILPPLAGHSDPAGLAMKLGDELSGDRFPAFLRVWWIHTGLYSGLLTGLICLIAIVQSRRKASTSDVGGASDTTSKK